MFSKLTLVVAAVLLCAIVSVASAQCNVATLKSASDFEKTALVIDVRPDEINQFRGKSSFKNEASIALVNMNPFLFSYSLKVDQTEIQDTGYLNFLKLLGAPVTEVLASASSAKAFGVTSGGSLDLLITRTSLTPAGPHSSCGAAQVADATCAIKQLAEVRQAVLDEMNGAPARLAVAAVPCVPAKPANAATLGIAAIIKALDGQFNFARTNFGNRKDIIFDSSVESALLCTTANALRTGLTGYPKVNALQDVLTQVRDFRSMVEELKSSAAEYKTEYEGCPARANGLNYADNLLRLATELAKVGAAYEAKVNGLINETKGYDALVTTIAGLKNESLQREYKVLGQYDINALDITATAVPLGEDSGLPRKDFAPQRVVGDIQSAQSDGRGALGNARLVSVGTTDGAQGVRVFSAHRAGFRALAKAADDDDDGERGDGEGGDTGAGAKQIKANATIGARRFEVSAGMAFSGLDRQEFKPVLGYPRNAQGEFIDPETGNTTTTPKLTQVVGLSEQSSRRFAPMALLHYRMPFHRNVFLSAGITGKNDDYGLNLEYLLGPSVLYKNMFFTFGGYAGKQQKLAGDLYQGAPVEGDFAVRKDYKWSWGFSFTYKIPLGSGTSK
jgi:hypothetical protein